MMIACGPDRVGRAESRRSTSARCSARWPARVATSSPSSSTARSTASAYWAEQLIAESTGKEGTGIVPIEGEPLGTPAVYGKDRLFVVRTPRRRQRPPVAGARPRRPSGGRAALEGPLRPRRRVHALGDRDGRRRLGARHRPVRSAERAGVEGQHGAARSPSTRPGALPSGGRRARHRRRRAADGPLAAARARRARADYVALTAYVAPNARRTKLLREIRIRHPRPLHGAATASATGRASCTRPASSTRAVPRTHRAPAHGRRPVDVPVPGERYSFGALEAAQAPGDYEALAARGRSVFRVHLGRNADRGLERLLAILSRRPRATPIKRRRGDGGSTREPVRARAGRRR